LWLAADQAGGAGRRVSEEGARGEAEATMGRFIGAPQPCPAGAP
jgi:hypothetical protein